MPVEARSGAWEQYRGAAPHCREKIHLVKAQLELSELWGTKNRIFFKHINGKRQCKNIISPFQDGDGHLTNRERDMAEVFSTSFVSVCKMWVTDQEGPSALSWRTMTVTVINPSQPETAGCAAPAESLQIRGPSWIYPKSSKSC